MADENVGLTGGIFYHATAVTNESTNELAEFRGGWSANIEETIVDWYGQQMTRKDATMVRLDVRLVVDEVAFKQATLETIWGATKDDSAVYLKDAAGTTAATSYTFSSSTTGPPELQYLIQCTLDGSIFQAYCDDGIALSTTINFTSEDYVVQNLEIMAYGASGTLVAFFIEQ